MVVAIVLGWVQVVGLVLSAVGAWTQAHGKPRPGLTGGLEQAMNQALFVALIPTTIVFVTCAWGLHTRTHAARVAFAVTTGVVAGLTFVVFAAIGGAFMVFGFAPAAAASILAFVPSSQPFFVHRAPYRLVPAGPGPDLRPASSEPPGPAG